MSEIDSADTATFELLAIDAQAVGGVGWYVFDGEYAGSARSRGSYTRM